MKTTSKTLVTIFIALLSISTQAQESLNKSKEFGLFAETKLNTYSSANSYSAFGLQYRKESKPNKFYRSQVMYQQKSNEYRSNDFRIEGDSLREVLYSSKNKGLFVGFGIEQQRHFYKKLHLYASLDARLGYGYSAHYKSMRSTRIDTSVNVFFANSNINYSKPEKISNMTTSRYSLDILPSIGSKLIFDKLILGFETGFNVSNAYQTQKNPNGERFSIYDLDLGLFLYRVYVNYRL